MRLKNKVSLITGASRGIGRAIAIKFASEGSNIILNYNRNESSALRICNEIEKMNVECLPVKADVSRKDDVGTMVKRSLDRFGYIDVLVNNAGIMITGTNRTEDLERMVGVNLYSMVYTIEALRENFMKRGGKIINIASVAGIVTSLTGTTFYSITKGAVITLTRRYAFDLGKYGVNVNAIAPGFIETDLTRTGKSDEEWRRTVEDISSKTALGRIGRPEDIANAAIFLASGESDFITGQVIVVDGGRQDFFTHSL
ncbi:MAG: glucose 1-dehydrogenase [Thermoplasmata archaeon]|jgi:3-oxoacyl-[acyl-carrier protein] reductase|nr:glucose 1-dehydrogenase [Thermoplasmatales archaeon]